MEMMQSILITALLFIRLCISINVLVTSIQSCIYDRRREKRELSRAECGKEYYGKHTDNLLNK